MRIDEVLAVREEELTPVVLVIGRFNPPTIGHARLIEKARECASKSQAVRILLIDGKESGKNLELNPLPAKRRKELMVDELGLASDDEIIIAQTIPKGIGLLADQGEVPGCLVCGSDRVEGYRDAFERFLDSPIEIVGVERNSDSLEAAASATAAREAARASDLKLFSELTGLSGKAAKKVAAEIRGKDQ
jgi:cytidyltransferase-like protein